jgi:Holliday junction DNA helicase RuvB
MSELFKDIIGQSQAKLAITDWYLHEQQPLLIYGSSGFGKTLFAETLGARTIDTTQFRGDRLSTILKPIKESEDGEILFFDEIHALQPKVLEGLYKIIDKGTFFDTELCMDLPIPQVRFIFATNILNPLPEAFKNRCRFVELQDYTLEELKAIIHKRYSLSDEKVLESIVRASKGVPRTALSLAQSVISGLKTESEDASPENVNNILASRFAIDPATGLNQKEFLIIQKVVERGRLSTPAVANLLKISLTDAKAQYIEPLRASEWIGVSSQGIIPGVKAHEQYRVFMKRKAK